MQRVTLDSFERKRSSLGNTFRQPFVSWPVGSPKWKEGLGHPFRSEWL
jgi:hypothetical protein